MTYIAKRTWIHLCSRSPLNSMNDVSEGSHVTHCTYRRFVRSQIIFANTMFCVVCYRPDECQIITAGTDRKIGYWETYDSSQIRELDGSKSDSINGMDIHGEYFVTGGGDRLIKVIKSQVISMWERHNLPWTNLEWWQLSCHLSNETFMFRCGYIYISRGYNMTCTDTCNRGSRVWSSGHNYKQSNWQGFVAEHLARMIMLRSSIEN